MCVVQMNERIIENKIFPVTKKKRICILHMGQLKMVSSEKYIYHV